MISVGQERPVAQEWNIKRNVLPTSFTYRVQGQLLDQLSGVLILMSDKF